MCVCVYMYSAGYPSPTDNTKSITERWHLADALSKSYDDWAQLLLSNNRIPPLFGRLMAAETKRFLL